MKCKFLGSPNINVMTFISDTDCEANGDSIV